MIKKGNTHFLKRNHENRDGNSSASSGLYDSTEAMPKSSTNRQSLKF